MVRHLVGLAQLELEVRSVSSLLLLSNRALRGVICTMILEGVPQVLARSQALLKRGPLIRLHQFVCSVTVDDVSGRGELS